MTYTEITISKIPTQDGRVDYIVPTGTMVMKDKDRIWAAPGDHIHGFIDPAGASLKVFDAVDCPFCQE